ncbi:MAG: hypothetical protein KIT45_06710 [Fimbriimonadia bacterium]|nr:hypothetical protein [Fimbriimonadia bacterium]
MQDITVDTVTDLGQAPDTEQAAGPDSSGPQQNVFDAHYVQQLRREAAQWRKQAQESADKIKQYEESQLSETERLQRQAQEALVRAERAERTAKEARLRSQIETTAAMQGVIDPEAAYRLMDLVSIDFDPEGNPQGVQEALSALLQAKPYLVAAPAGVSQTSPTQPGGAGQAASATGTFTRAQLADPEFYEAHRTAIFAALRDGRIVDHG